MTCQINKKCVNKNIMPNSFTQLYIHIVFAPKGRQNFLLPTFSEEVRKYITGIIQSPERKCKLLAINNMPDHIHILIGLHPAYPISKLIQEIKNNTTNFINDNKFLKHKFSWQDGYGAFSVSFSHRQTVLEYIKQQQTHHHKVTFAEEYRRLLEKNGVEFDDAYLFELYD